MRSFIYSFPWDHPCASPQTFFFNESTPFWSITIHSFWSMIIYVKSDWAIYMYFFLTLQMWQILFIYIYIHNLSLVITVPAEPLAPNGARPSTDTVMTTNCKVPLVSFTIYDSGYLFGDQTQAGKLKFFGTRPNWAVSYIAYTKFPLPRPVLHLPGQIFTGIGEWAG